MHARLRAQLTRSAEDDHAPERRSCPMSSPKGALASSPFVHPITALTDFATKEANVALHLADDETSLYALHIGRSPVNVALHLADDVTPLYALDIGRSAGEQLRKNLSRSHCTHQLDADTARVQEKLEASQSFENRQNRSQSRTSLLPGDNQALFTNIGAGAISGIKRCLGAVVFAGITFGGQEEKILSEEGFALGIVMNMFGSSLHMTMVSLMPTGSQFCPVVTVIQDVSSIVMAQVAEALVTKEPRIPREHLVPTVCVAQLLSALAFGASCLLVGKLSWGSLFKKVPYPVIGGFLGAIGASAFRSGIELSTGSKLRVDGRFKLGGLREVDGLTQLALALLFWRALRDGPAFLSKRLKHKMLKSMTMPIIFLTPIAVFHITCVLAGLNYQDLREGHAPWLYGATPSRPFYELWPSIFDVKAWELAALFEVGIVPMFSMLILSLLTALLVMGGLELVMPPEGIFNMDQELIMLGIRNVCLACVGSPLAFHSSGGVNTKIDGGTHHVSGLVTGLFLFVVFLSGAPLSAYIPKFVVAGNFFNLGFVFLKQWGYSTYWSLPLRSFLEIWVMIIAYLFTGLVTTLLIGFAIALAVFMQTAMTHNPIFSVSRLDVLHSSVGREDDEMRALLKQGHQVTMIRLHGRLFWGMADSFADIGKALSSSIPCLAPEVVLFDLTYVHHIDISILQALEQLRKQVNKIGMSMKLVGVQPQVMNAFAKTSMHNIMDQCSFNQALVNAEEELLRAAEISLLRPGKRWDALVRKAFGYIPETLKFSQEPGGPWPESKLLGNRLARQLRDAGLGFVETSRSGTSFQPQHAADERHVALIVCVRGEVQVWNKDRNNPELAMIIRAGYPVNAAAFFTQRPCVVEYIMDGWQPTVLVVPQMPPHDHELFQPLSNFLVRSVCYDQLALTGLATATKVAHHHHDDHMSSTPSEVDADALTADKVGEADTVERSLVTI